MPEMGIVEAVQEGGAHQVAQEAALHSEQDLLEDEPLRRVELPDDAAGLAERAKRQIDVEDDEQETGDAELADELDVEAVSRGPARVESVVAGAVGAGEVAQPAAEERR